LTVECYLYSPIRLFLHLRNPAGHRTRQSRLVTHLPVGYAEEELPAPRGGHAAPSLEGLGRAFRRLVDVLRSRIHAPPDHLAGRRIPAIKGPPRMGPDPLATDKVFHRCLHDSTSSRTASP